MNRLMQFLLIARTETRFNKGQRTGYITVYLRRWVIFLLAVNRILKGIR